MGSRRSTLHVGHLAGVPIGIQPLWLVIVGLITYSLGHDYFPAEDPGLSSGAAYALGLASALGLFAGIVAHELGHAVVARRRGVAVDEIDLWLLGGVARLRGEPRAPGDELRYAAAGPAVTAAILVVFAALRLALGGVVPDWARAFIEYQLYVAAAILGFNLLPAFPLDGGRILRALLWRRGGDRERATERAARTGRLFGWALVWLGFLAFLNGLVGGLWFALIGGFIIVASGAEAQGMRTQQAFAGLRAADVMTPDPVTLHEAVTLEDAVVVGFARHLFTAFPIVDDDGRAVGLLPIAAVRATPAPDRARVRAGQAAVRDPALLAEPELAVAELLERPAFQRLGRAVVVDAEGRPVGLVSATDLERRLQAERLLPPLRHAA